MTKTTILENWLQWWKERCSMNLMSHGPCNWRLGLQLITEEWDAFLCWHGSCTHWNSSRQMAAGTPKYKALWMQGLTMTWKAVWNMNLKIRVAKKKIESSSRKWQLWKSAPGTFSHNSLARHQHPDQANFWPSFKMDLAEDNDFSLLVVDVKTKVGKNT